METRRKKKQTQRHTDVFTLESSLHTKTSRGCMIALINNSFIDSKESLPSNYFKGLTSNRLPSLYCSLAI